MFGGFFGRLRFGGRSGFDLLRRFHGNRLLRLLDRRLLKDYVFFQRCETDRFLRLFGGHLLEERSIRDVGNTDCFRLDRLLSGGFYGLRLFEGFDGFHGGDIHLV